MTAKLFLSLTVAFAIVSQSQALLGQDVERETYPSHKNDRWIESVPSRVSRASLIKRDTRIAQKIRDLRGTSDSAKKTKKSKSMSKQIKSSKGEDGNEGDDADGSDGNEGNDSDGSDGNEGNDSDGSDGNDLPEGSDFDISDCGSYSNEWLTELAKYCGDDLEELSGCECPPARELLADGTLVCATENELGMSPPACPEDCPVCEFCMVLEGCKDIYDP